MRVKLIVISVLISVVGAEAVDGMIRKVGFKQDACGDSLLPALKNVAKFRPAIHKKKDGIESHMNKNNVRFIRRNSTIGIPGVVQQEVNNNIQGVFSPVSTSSQSFQTTAPGNEMTINSKSSVYSDSEVSSTIPLNSNATGDRNLNRGRYVPFGRNNVNNGSVKLIDESLGSVLYGMKIAAKLESNIINESLLFKEEDNKDANVGTYERAFKPDFLYSRYFKRQLDRVVNWQRQCSNNKNIMGLGPNEIITKSLEMKQTLGKVGFEIEDILLGFMLGSRQILKNHNMNMLGQSVKEHLEAVLEMKKMYLDALNETTSKPLNKDPKEDQPNEGTRYFLNRIRELEEQIKTMNEKHKEEIKELEDTLWNERELNLIKNMQEGSIS